MAGIRITSAKAASYALDLRIEATPARVWAALTAEIDAWWLPDFHTARSPSTMSLEPVPGGRLLERTADGGGVLWYTVHAVDPGRALTLVGPLSSGEGPGSSTLALSLAAEDGGCRLTLANGLFGRFDDALPGRLRDGWETLLGQGLKAYVEGSG
jgi:uncharacterized protein YndB with AHSA1/START domain